MKIHVLTLVFISTVFSASCANIHRDYPTSWAAIKTSHSGVPCPNLSGLYQENGEAPNGCHVWIEKCGSLSYNLLSGNIGYEEVWDESETPNFRNADQVEILQKDNDQLEIALWDARDHEKHLVHKESLKSKDGDFTCTEEGIRLKARLLYFLWGISNILGKETRDFSIMKTMT